jgi:hypothetical protein
MRAQICVYECNLIIKLSSVVVVVVIIIIIIIIIKL